MDSLAAWDRLPLAQMTGIALMQFRKLTDSERGIVDRLLVGDFPGRVAIIEQINQSLVRQIDEDGSLEFESWSGSHRGLKVPHSSGRRDGRRRWGADAYPFTCS
ncbi:MAG: hypothetical protein JWM21_1228 [Acidobacteria bacterium]|nr:hypothetical protein [Acidobacteriota bacterium]